METTNFEGISSNFVFGNLAGSQSVNNDDAFAVLEPVMVQVRNQNVIGKSMELCGSTLKEACASLGMSREQVMTAAWCMASGDDKLVAMGRQLLKSACPVVAKDDAEHSTKHLPLNEAGLAVYLSDIKVKVKRVHVRPLKSGKEKTAWGADVVMGGQVYPVYFKNMHAAFLYVATLLRSREGKLLHREALKESPNLDPRIAKRSEESEWLEKLFNLMFAGKDKCFRTWRQKMADGNWHQLDSGKSQTKTDLKRVFSDEKICDFLEIEKKLEHEGDVHCSYFMNLKPEQIEVCKELDF